MFITHNKSHLGLEVTFLIFIGNDWFYLLNRTSLFGLSIALCTSLVGIIFQEVISGISQFVVIVLFTILLHHPPTSLMPVLLSDASSSEFLFAWPALGEPSYFGFAQRTSFCCFHFLFHLLVSISFIYSMIINFSFLSLDLTSLYFASLL